MAKGSKSRWVGLTAVVALAIALGWALGRKSTGGAPGAMGPGAASGAPGKGPGGPGKGRGPMGPIPVEGVVVHDTAFSDIVRASGTLRANEEVELRPEATGKLVRVSFREGSRVKKGQVLAKIDDSELRANLSASEARLALAKGREARQRGLLEKQGVSQEQYDEVAGELQVAAAQVELLKAQLAKTEIRAPFDGIVGIRKVSEGGYVNPQTVVASIQDVDRLKLDFAVPARYAGRLRSGDTVRFAFAGAQRHAVVAAVEPKVEAASQSLDIRALLANPGGELVPGTYVEVESAMASRRSILVPAIAVLPAPKGQQVFVARGGKAQALAVGTGTREAGHVEVVSGLTAGDTVLVSGLLQLRDGAPVAVNGAR